MDAVWDNSLLLVGLLGAFFFASAIYARLWARRQRQFHDFEKGARSVFDDEEPEGAVTDHFPGETHSAGSDVETKTPDSPQPPKR